MKAGSILIESAGILCTIQDAGRFGYQRYGMPVSGAMDVYSLQLANSLVGNLACEACIEATLTGPVIIFKSPAFIAICGADMLPFINANRVQNNMTIRVSKEDRLHFAGLKTGCRAYIAVAGGFKIAKVMGSKSTYLRAATGGFEGRALKTGDTLELVQVMNDLNIKTIPYEFSVNYENEDPVRIIAGPEIKMFEFDAIRSLLTTPYVISAQSDRMGYRLHGETLKHITGKADILSSGIPMGTIQVPGSGQPIILMADRQTTGGYARIAIIASIDLTRVAQLKPGDTIRFREIRLDEAQQLYLKRQELIRELFN